MFRQRIFASLIAAPLGLFLVYQGGVYFFLAVTSILLIATMEYTHLTQKMGWNPFLPLLLIAIFVQLLAGQWRMQWLAPSLVISLITIMAYALWQYEYRASQTAMSDWLVMTVGVVILGWVGAHALLLRNLDDMAWQWTILAVLSSWSIDTASYLVGKFLAGKILGKHALSPRLSPNKTIEGYIGGIIIGTIFIVIIAYYLQISLGIALFLGLLASTITPLGDLAISMIKREAGVKDSGVLLPGHGGALDRIDSLLWSVVITYYLATLINV